MTKGNDTEMRKLFKGLISARSIPITSLCDAAVSSNRLAAAMVGFHRAYVQTKRGKKSNRS